MQDHSHNVLTRTRSSKGPSEASWETIAWFYRWWSPKSSSDNSVKRANPKERLGLWGWDHPPAQSELKNRGNFLNNSISSFLLLVIWIASASPEKLFAFAFVFHICLIIQTTISSTNSLRAKDQVTSSYLYQLAGKKYSTALHPRQGDTFLSVFFFPVGEI